MQRIHAWCCRVLPHACRIPIEIGYPVQCMVGWYSLQFTRVPCNHREFTIPHYNTWLKSLPWDLQQGQQGHCACFAWEVPLIETCETWVQDLIVTVWQSMAVLLKYWYVCGIHLLTSPKGAHPFRYTHIKSRVEAAPEVELFPYILDNTRTDCAIIGISGIVLETCSR